MVAVSIVLFHSLFTLFLLSVPSSLLTISRLVHRRLHYLLHLTLSPSTCLLDLSNSLLSYCLLSVSLIVYSLLSTSLTRFTMTRLCLSCAVSSHCRISGLWTPRTFFTSSSSICIPGTSRRCRGNISSARSVSAGTHKATGNGRQRQTSAGPLVPYPGNFGGPDVREKICLPGNLDGAAGLGRRPPETAGLAGGKRDQQRPPNLANAAHTLTSPGSLHFTSSGLHQQ